MGGGGKGGKADSSSMIEYGNKALGLQKEIYDTQRADAQPWYQTGTAAVGQLSKLMGLNGKSANANPATRQSLYDQYKGQFTTGSPSTSGSQYIGPDGRIYDTSESSWLGNFLNNQKPDSEYLRNPSARDWRPENLTNMGFKSLSTGGGQTVDTAGLNAYIDNLLAAQGAANESDPAFGSLAQKFDMEDFQTDPGYQFRLGEGQKALERKLNASGKTFSPEAAKALLGYNQDMGSNEYNNAYNRFNIDQDNLFNRLATLSGFGQTASGQIANAGSQYAQGGTDLYTGMGNAITSANLANKANNSSMFNSLLGAGAQLGAAKLAGAAFMSDMRLKFDFDLDKPYDEIDGHKRYIFRYNTMPEKQFIGVMAQQVMEIDPLAVEMTNDGYYAVDYGKLGFEMEEV